MKGSKYVAKKGSKHVYTTNVKKARVFLCLSDAEKSVCLENETIVSITDHLKDIFWK